MKASHRAAQYLSRFLGKFSLGKPRPCAERALQDGSSPTLGGDGVNVRQDTGDLILRALDYVPSRRIAREVENGRAYFERYQFSADAKLPSLAKTSVAVRELASRRSALKIGSDDPIVSIIIPVFGQLHFVLNCLDSLAAHESRFSLEILVVDDASPSNMNVEELRVIPWIRYIRRKENGGFIKTCNEAAKGARGEYLLFLNSDIRVAAGWLDELIGSFALFPKAGLVGSKLYNEDGSLQDAGGIFWREGTAWNYGRNDDGNDPKYCFARKADYCSGASIAVSKCAWEEMEGFDELFEPAYCEDADIAFRLREAGYEVWMQPLSCALHYEGRTHGRDLARGMKSYQVGNMKKFYHRWKTALLAHRPDAEAPDQEANRQATKRVLVLDAETPMPNRDCGSVFVIQMVKTFQGLGYQVTFAPHLTYFFDGKYTEDLQRLGVECLYAPYLSGIDDILQIRNDFDLVLVYRYYVLNPIYETIRNAMPLARIIFSNVDLHYLREEREAQLIGSQRALSLAMITKGEEFEALCRADCSIVHTDVEANIIRQQIALENIVELPYLAASQPSDVRHDQRFDLMFLGGFRHLPNIDAVLHFTERVWPKLLDRLPARARFVVVGASPPPEIERLAGDRIVVTGFVEDLIPWFEAARVFIAPLRFGAGIKGKVIESLRHGTPSVLTPIAAEGIGITSGLEAFVAASDEDFADAVLRLYDDLGIWQAMQSAGYDLVQRRFSEDRFTEICSDIIKKSDQVWMGRQEYKLKQRLNALEAGGQI